MTKKRNQDNAGIALVTGASRGIGAAVALRLAEDGFDIWLNYNRSHAAAAKVAAEIEAKGAACKLLPFDVQDPAACTTVLEPLLKENIPYVLVNNAGITSDTVMAMMTGEQWRDVLAVHLDGFFNVTSRVLPFMMRKRAGRIINIASTAGQTGVAGQVNYIRG